MCLAVCTESSSFACVEMRGGRRRHRAISCGARVNAPTTRYGRKMHMHIHVTRLGVSECSLPHDKHHDQRRRAYAVWLRAETVQRLVHRSALFDCIVCHWLHCAFSARCASHQFCPHWVLPTSCHMTVPFPSDQSFVSYELDLQQSSHSMLRRIFLRCVYNYDQHL